MEQVIRELKEQEVARQEIQTRSWKQIKYFCDTVSDNLIVKKLGAGMFEVNGAMVVGAKDVKDALCIVKSGETELCEAYSRTVSDDILELQSIGLSLRAAICVTRAGFHSISEFLNAKEEDFSPERQIQNLSPKVREEILRKLRSFKIDRIDGASFMY